MIHDYGGRALLIDCGSTDEVIGLANAMRRDAPSGVVDVVAGARTVLVTVSDAEALAAVRAWLAVFPTPPPTPPPPPGAADV